MATDQGKTLYEILNVDKGASQAEIKKAYRVLCLQLHPDKNPDEEAKSKFQSLQKVYDVLGDAEKRAAYDETGITDEDLLGDQTSNLFKYFSRAFKKVTPEDLDAVYDEYRGSQEESRDLINLYEKHSGDMSLVFECAMCSDESIDAHRFMDTIRAAIDAGEVKEYRAFKTWCKGVQKRPRPADPLKKRSHKGQDAGPSSALVASIKQNSKANFLAFMDKLEDKYTTGPKGKGAKGKGKAHAEPTDEEFEAIQARILGNKTEAKPAPAAKSKAKGKASQGRKKINHVEELGSEDDDDDEGDEEEESGDDSGSEEEEEEVVVTVKRGAKGGSAKGAEKQATKRKADVETGAGEAGSGKKRKGSQVAPGPSKRKGKAGEGKVQAESEEEEGAEEEEERARPKAKGKGKPNSGKAKKKAHRAWYE